MKAENHKKIQDLTNEINTSKIEKEALAKKQQEEKKIKEQEKATKAEQKKQEKAAKN